MSTLGEGEGGRGVPGGPNPNVADLLQKLNMTADEEAVLDFSDEEEDAQDAPMEWALVGKVLSPMVLSVKTITGAIKPAWGNPLGLKLRSIVEKNANMFVAEFGCESDRDHALAGSPWIMGKYSVLLKMFDGKLSDDEISLDQMEIWVRILNLPLGWMNDKKGL
ncbi:hypothetical protein QOZ80_4AG0326950 [Eleusine coracana subsp. coracana]|nr:hypothetical protein QOZ80_4AG0326950 [Eleusine coracana subsp. coracana]